MKCSLIRSTALAKENKKKKDKSRFQTKLRRDLGDEGICSLWTFQERIQQINTLSLVSQSQLDSCVLMPSLGVSIQDLQSRTILPCFYPSRN